MAQSSDIAKRLFGDDSQNDFEEHASPVPMFVPPPGEPASKRVKIEDLAKAVLQMQMTMQEQSAGILEAVRVASAAATASMSMASAMQQGFALMGPSGQQAQIPVPIAPTSVNDVVVAAVAALATTTAASSSGVSSEGRRGGANSEVGRIPPELEKHISKVTSQFEKQVVKFLKNKELLSAGIEQLKVLNEPGTIRYPSGIRPFKSPEERLDLDDVLQQCQSQESVLSISLTTGTTRRAAMQQVHHFCTKFLKAVDNEGRQSYVDALKVSVTRKAFIDSCTSWRPHTVDSLELDEPSRTQFNDACATARIEKSYAHVVDRVRERKAAQVQQQADEAKRKKDEEDNLLKHKPEVLLHDLIDERVSVKVHEISGDVSMCDADPKKSDGKLSSFVKSLQKNGSSPEGAPGGASVNAVVSKAKQQVLSFKKGKKTKGKGKGKAKTVQVGPTSSATKGASQSSPQSPGKGNVDLISSFSSSPASKGNPTPPRRQGWNHRWFPRTWGAHGNRGKGKGSERGGKTNVQENQAEWNKRAWASWR